MKYQLLFAFVAFASIQIISGDDLLQKLIAQIEKNAARDVNRIVNIMYKEGQEFNKQINKMEDKIADKTNTSQCQELKTTLQKDSVTLNKMNLQAINAGLKIRQDILNVETACAKNSTTVLDIIKCVKQNMDVVVEDIAQIKTTLENDRAAIKAMFKEAGQQFADCLKSQYVTSPKPQPTTNANVPTTAM